MFFSFALFYFLTLCILLYLFLFIAYKNKIYSIGFQKSTPTILVLGAGLEPNGEPSDILKDRLITTKNIIFNYRPDKVILSGSQSSSAKSETAAMFDFLSKHIHIDNLLIQDNFGKSTLDSLINFYDAQYAQPVAIVSQRFHLTRALFLGDSLGLNCIGITAENKKFSIIKIIYWYFRELIATPYNIVKIFLYNYF